MGLLGGLIKLAATPVIVAAEVVQDVVGENGEGSQMASIGTMGLSSVVKGAAKNIVDVADDVTDGEIL